METLEDICGAIDAADSLVVCTHVSPDADAIGSSAAFARSLNQTSVANTTFTR